MAQPSTIAVTLVTDDDVTCPRSIPAAGGTAVVYTRRNPNRLERNEDAAAIISCDDQRAVLAVADGLGGQPAGDQASRIAMMELQKSVEHAAVERLDLRGAILSAFENANRQVTALGLGAATTLAVVEIDGQRARSYHAGDSAILIVGQRGRIRSQTIDHSPVGYGVHAGVIDESDAMDHEERHLILNMVGCDDMRIDVGPAIQLRARDTVLLATDGLTDNLRVAEIVERIRKGPIQKSAAALAEQCAERMESEHPPEPHKPDDVTFIAYRPGA